MTMQLSRLRRALGPSEACTVDFLEATRVTTQTDPMLKKLFGEGPYYNWYDVTNDRNIRMSTDPARYIEALLDPSISFLYEGAEESMDQLERHIETSGPYDALVGFSQGGIIITMLTARRLQRAARGEATPPSWRCNVLLASMPPRTTAYAPAFPEPLSPPISASYPCVAVVGKKDPFLQYARRLQTLYGRMDWFEHAGGHESAKEPEVNTEVAAAIWRALDSNTSDR
jgi:predicted esterase